MSPVATTIAVSELRVRRGGNLVLPGVSLEVSSGVVTGLLGPSGSGKTTLLRSIVGVQVVESGSVRVLGLPAGSAEVRSRIGYVTQAPSVYGDLTVRENLDYFAAIVDAPKARIAETIGLLVPRDQMADALEWISYVFPLTYAIDALIEVTTNGDLSQSLALDLAVIVGSILLALLLGAATLRRRTT